MKRLPINDKTQKPVAKGAQKKRIPDNRKLVKHPKRKHMPGMENEKTRSSKVRIGSFWTRQWGGSGMLTQASLRELLAIIRSAIELQKAPRLLLYPSRYQSSEFAPDYILYIVPPEDEPKSAKAEYEDAEDDYEYTDDDYEEEETDEY